MKELFDKLIVCVDMAGCPNRCRHCWLGHAPNRRMELRKLEEIAEMFRPYGRKFEIDGWYREPDYRDDYKELWALEERLSSDNTPHFELMSYWRAVRDESYIPWLAEKGVKATQMTFFGGREMTDKYYQRKGAYDELVSLIDPLRRAGIMPRFQAFVNKENVNEMDKIVELAESTGLADAAEFRAFVHAGGCDGANEKLYDIRVTPEDVEKLPARLVKWSEQHWGRNINDVFGRTEAELCREMAEEEAPIGLKKPDVAVLYVDHELNVYPNITEPQPAWCFGNLERDGAERIMQRVHAQDTPAMRVMKEVPAKELVKQCGDAQSRRLFDRGDYETYLVNRYAREALP